MTKLCERRVALEERMDTDSKLTGDDNSDQEPEYMEQYERAQAQQQVPL